MPSPKRPDPKRRSAASRPNRAGATSRARPRRTTAPRRGTDAAHISVESVLAPIKQSISAAADRRSELKVGFTARRAVILAAVMCVLTLTIAGPVRTFFAQRTEMKQQTRLEVALRQQIAGLEQQKANLADPAHIKAQARQRLGFVMPGEVPYQVQLPPAAELPGEPGIEPALGPSGDPWYTALWHTIADAPHGPPAAVPDSPPPVEPPPPAPAPPPAGSGG